MASNSKEKQRVYSQTWRDKHPEKKRSDSKRYYQENREKIVAYAKKLTPEQVHAYHIRNAFGMEPEQYASMLVAQNGVCAICLRPCASGRRLAVDHNHETNVIRGLLCSNCNRGIGLLGDDPVRVQAAAHYLSRVR